MSLPAESTTRQWDAETLSYKAASQKAGESAEEVNGLLTLFSNGRPLVRHALWTDLKVQQQ